MPRYFMEVSYNGARYAGFQIQDNAVTVQGEIEKALQVYFRVRVELTGSSRTDAGVHALQNFFHFDLEGVEESEVVRSAYHLNAILPPDIAVNSIFGVGEEAHCRFDARWRAYQYTIYSKKDPFLEDRAYFFPYTLDKTILDEAAAIVLQTKDFQSFSKKRVQVRHFLCDIFESRWEREGHSLVYKVRGNRFLRGMVRGLTGTMLRVGTGKLDMEEFRAVIASGDPAKVDFSVPPQGLRLMEVGY